jgi:hypothetical protein
MKITIKANKIQIISADGLSHKDLTIDTASCIRDFECKNLISLMYGVDYCVSANSVEIIQDSNIKEYLMITFKT